MDAVDTNSRQSVGLPPMNHIDSDRLKREEADYQRKHSAPSMVSPSYPYSCPPPPYSQPTPAANSVPNGLSGLISPPESRRTSEEEKEQKQAPRPSISLPSIHEAIGGAEPPANYPSSTSTAHAPGLSGYQQVRPPSPQDHLRRNYTLEPSQPSHQTQFAQPPPRSPYPSASHAVPPPPPQAAAAPPSATRLPALTPLRTAQSPVNSSRPSLPYSYQPQQSPSYEPRDPYSAGASVQAANYQQQPAGYPYSAPTAQPGAAVYPPNGVYSAPPRYNTSSSWRSDGAEISRVEESKRAGRLAGPAYGESVKRHLDNFDLEASLNEIAEGSGRMLEFTKHYGARAHQTQRSGPVPGSIPSMVEVDELMQQQRRIADAVERIRNVVVQTEEAARAEQAQDARYKAANGFGSEDPNGYQDDKNGGGFAGSDPKKRRGRAAPPGRCHSCNRAETPEWRRGPDGARTLCNACGLHYAKLTRKMGTNKVPVGSSNLRPKGPEV